MFPAVFFHSFPGRASWIAEQRTGSLFGDRLVLGETQLALRVTLPALRNLLREFGHSPKPALQIIL